MYETWVKHLIDILDERAPVTIVKNRLELPLGSVAGEMSTTVHARLDLTDEDSPWCDLVLEQAEDEVHCGYMIHIPNINKRTDTEIIANVRSIGSITSLSLLSPVGEMGQETYVIKGHLNAPLDHPFDNPNSATHDMAEKLVHLMQVGGYEAQKEADGVDVNDDLVSWPVE